MKKILFFSAVAALLVSCSNDETVGTPDVTTDVSLPETEVFVQGQQILSSEQSSRMNAPMTRANYAWPLVNETEGWETARFSIRADGQIVDYFDKSSALYFGRSPGKVGNNKGKVFSLYPYGHYNDRDFDYYQRDKKTGSNIGLFRYVYDPQGLKTQAAIMEAPSVVDILGDEVTDLEAAIASNPSDTKSISNLEKVNALLALNTSDPEYLDKHVLWYVVKEVGMKNGWHVNGVIADYEVPSYTIDRVPNNVEVDIHQQEHKDWNEIKTSLHIRADVESVTINIPLRQEDVIERDDFAIRVFDFDYSEYHISHTVTHDANGITIEITGISAELIQNLKDNFGDGLTIEIHSYCTTNDIWEQLSKSRVVKTGKPCTVNGQISSALRPDEQPIPIYIDKK